MISDASKNDIIRAKLNFRGGGGRGVFPNPGLPCSWVVCDIVWFFRAKIAIDSPKCHSYLVVKGRIPMAKRRHKASQRKILLGACPRNMYTHAIFFNFELRSSPMLWINYSNFWLFFFSRMLWFVVRWAWRCVIFLHENCIGFAKTLFVS